MSLFLSYNVEKSQNKEILWMSSGVCMFDCYCIYLLRVIEGQFNKWQTEDKALISLTAKGHK